MSGDVKNPGVFEFSEDWSIEQILKETNNFPDFPFFVQVGGGASGQIKAQTVKTHEELDEKVGGSGSIIVYDKEKTDPKKLMKKWVDFYFEENCGKCVPCREGVYRIREMLDQDLKDEKNRETLKEIIFNLKESSFCPLGKSVSAPFESFLEKIY